METIEYPIGLEYYRSKSLTNRRLDSIIFYTKSTETNRYVGFFINIQILLFVFLQLKALAYTDLIVTMWQKNTYLLGTKKATTE